MACVLAFFDRANRLIIKLHDKAGRLVAHSRLPHEFIVKANGNCVRSNRRGAHTTAPQQALRPDRNLPPVNSLEPTSPEPPASSRRSQLNSSHVDPVLRRLSPADGPTSGGPIITILGINFPPPTQQIIYVKFGTVAVPTVWPMLLLQEETYPILRPGTIHTRLSASCLLLRLLGQSKLHSLYIKSPELHNSVTATAGLNIIRNMTTCR